MNEFVKSLQREINRKIDKVERSEKDTIKKALEASHILGEAFDRLKKFTLDYTFKDENEEIDFFKDKKPRFCSRLIYYRKLYNVEMNRPHTDVATQKEYLDSLLDEINQYTAKRLDFIRYYRSGKTYLDRQYFLRGQKETGEYFETFLYDFDPTFSTPCDFQVAQVLANDMLTAYILTELERLEADKEPVNYRRPGTTLKWHGSKTGLLELIYALDSAKRFGDIPLSRLASDISRVFNITMDISNISRAFGDMKIRNNPTPELDELTDALLKRMKRDKDKK